MSILPGAKPLVGWPAGFPCETSLKAEDDSRVKATTSHPVLRKAVFQLGLNAGSLPQPEGLKLNLTPSFPYPCMDRVEKITAKNVSHLVADIALCATHVLPVIDQFLPVETVVSRS